MTLTHASRRQCRTRAGAGLLACLVALCSDAAHLVPSDLAAMTEQCEAAREALLAPLREQAIAACTARGMRDADGCRRYYRDFGNAIVTQNRTVPRRFHDIPECAAADNAARHFRLHPR